MDFFELVQKRYSVRAYKPDPVEDDKLQQVLKPRGWRRRRPIASRSSSS